MRFLGKQSIAALVGLAALLVISSCKTKKSESGQSLTIDSITGKPALAVTKIEFSEMEHDFGKIEQGQAVEHVFKFKNTGDSPLVVSDARASCGCTIPEWTKDPVQPGQEGKINVKYNSAGKSGLIHKTVTIYANTESKETVLNIQAEVIVPLKGPFKN